jgi:hypothetical protein
MVEGEIEEEVTYFTLRDVSTIALDGAQYRALQQNLSRSEYLRRFLKEAFYDDGMRYRRMLQEQAG